MILRNSCLILQNGVDLENIIWKVLDSLAKKMVGKRQVLGVSKKRKNRGMDERFFSMVLEISHILED